MGADASKLKSEDVVVRDPVCGMEKPKSQMKASTVYKGKTYYFCWENDKEMFLANPEHWVPREEKKGGD